MKKTLSTLAVLAISFAGLQTASSGDCFYGGPCSDGGSSDNGCCFSYDYIDVAYMSSDFTSGFDTAAVAGGATTSNASIVDEMRGVNVEFKKSIGCNFYLAGEFYNIDGPLSDEIVALRRQVAGDNLLDGKRAEFYYYRMGVGMSHSISDSLDFTIDGGGLLLNCEIPGKDEDQWGWYISPGLRFCLGGLGEAYVNYMYENFERMENHRFDGGVIIPLPCSDCMSVKLGGRYETAHETTTLLAGLRFNY